MEFGLSSNLSYSETLSVGGGYKPFVKLDLKTLALITHISRDF